MASEGFRNIKGMAADITEGFVTVNPLFLKTLSAEDIKALSTFLNRKLNETRTEPIQNNDLIALRHKNLKLQRIYLAVNVIKNYAKLKKIRLEGKEEKSLKKGFKGARL